MYIFARQLYACTILYAAKISQLMNQSKYFHKQILMIPKDNFCSSCCDTIISSIKACSDIKRLSSAAFFLKRVNRWQVHATKILQVHVFTEFCLIRDVVSPHHIWTRLKRINYKTVLQSFCTNIKLVATHAKQIIKELGKAKNKGIG